MIESTMIPPAKGRSFINNYASILWVIGLYLATIIILYSFRLVPQFYCGWGISSVWSVMCGPVGGSFFNNMFLFMWEIANRVFGSSHINDFLYQIWLCPLILLAIGFGLDVLTIKNNKLLIIKRVFLGLLLGWWFYSLATAYPWQNLVKKEPVPKPIIIQVEDVSHK